MNNCNCEDMGEEGHDITLEPVVSERLQQIVAFAVESCIVQMGADITNFYS